MQAVVSGQAAVGVAVSAIQLLGALASVKASPAGATVMEESTPETRSAFVFFALSTVFYVFSAGAYAWLMKTPEYREINSGHRTRRISLSMSQNFTDDDEGAGLVSGRLRDATPSPVARTIAMIKTNLAFNFTVAWVFIVTLVRGKTDEISSRLTHIVVRVPPDHCVCASDGPYDQPPHLHLPSLLCLQRGGLFRSIDLLVAPTNRLVRSSFSSLITPPHTVHSSVPPLQCSVPPVDRRAPPGHFLRLDVYVDSPCLRLVEWTCFDTWHDCLRVY